MAERTTQTTVVFQDPFRIEGASGRFPAGSYVIEIDEEQIQGLSFVAYRRLQTTIVVPTQAASHTERQFVVVEPQALQAALDRDAKISAGNEAL